MDPFLFPYLFISLFIEGGKFSFCRFAEKKNRGTGRKLAISWKSKLPSAAATGASYFQKMALALPSSIMHSGIQNRNKEMALDSKYTIRRLYESSQDSIRSQTRPTGDHTDVSFAYRTFLSMALLSDEYDTTYQIIKKEFMITKIRILFMNIYKRIDACITFFFCRDCQFIL